MCCVATSRRCSSNTFIIFMFMLFSVVVVVVVGGERKLSTVAGFDPALYCHDNQSHTLRQSAVSRSRDTPPITDTSHVTRNARAINTASLPGKIASEQAVEATSGGTTANYTVISLSSGGNMAVVESPFSERIGEQYLVNTSSRQPHWVSPANSSQLRQLGVSLLFSRRHYKADVLELADPGSLVTAVVAFEQNFEPIRYHFVDDSGQLTSQLFMFHLDADTGVVRLVSEMFTFVEESYQLTVRAESSVARDTASLLVRVIDVNDHRPQFIGCDSYHAVINETMPLGTPVFHVGAVDADRGENAEIVYSLLNTPDTSQRQFIIDANTGLLTTAQVFDRDPPRSDRAVRVIVKATDRGSSPQENTCAFTVHVLDVNDNAPQFDASHYSAYVSVEWPVGSHVLWLSASDSDSGDNGRIKYQLHATSSAQQEYLVVHASTGQVTLNKQLSQLPSNHVFELEAVAEDMGVPALSSRVQLFVSLRQARPEAPTFVLVPNHVYTLHENYDDTHTAIVQVKAELVNSTGRSQIYYSFTRDLIESTNSKRTFMMQHSSGTDQAVTVRYSGNTQLDYEHIHKYNITIRATTDQQTWAEVQFCVQLSDLNDQLPLFYENGVAVVGENMAAGTFVTVVSALDADLTAPNNKVSYRLAHNSTDNHLFLIDSDSGEIRTRVSFDREDRSRPAPFYTVTVIAEDGAVSAISNNQLPNQARKLVFVEIGDLNDNPPEFVLDHSYTALVAENSNIGQRVIKVTATDLDSEPWIRYEITAGNDHALFSIASATGFISTARQLDYELQQQHVLTVTATDGRFEATHSVLVLVQNVNDVPPVFDRQVYELTMREQLVSHEPIIKVTATDPDPVGTATIIYGLSGAGINEHNSSASMFSISRDGHIKLLKPLDRDRKTGGRVMWQLSVLAWDGRLGTLAPLVITLTDINDNAPYVVQSNSSVPIITENIDYRGVKILIEADDFDDYATNGPPYSFQLDPAASSNIRSKFAVNDLGNNKAEIVPMVRFDREQQKQYLVPILVRDNPVAEPRQLTATSLFRVLIGDQNDNIMSDGVSHVHVFNFEGKMPSTVIGRVYVEDADDWDLPDKTFSWRDDQHDNRQRFSLNQLNGDITIHYAVASGTYTLQFEVVDIKFATRVRATVHVHVVLLPRRAVLQSGSMRLHGVSARDFLSPTPLHNGRSQYELLRELLAVYISTAAHNVHIFSVEDTSGEMTAGAEVAVDVRFAAHGSPYYQAVKLNSLVALNRADLEQQLSMSVSDISLDQCMNEYTCYQSASCYSQLNVFESQVFSITTNKSSIVGVRTSVHVHCGACEPALAAELCLNEGVWNEAAGRCECRDGLEGAHCEGLHISFNGRGYAWFDGFTACEVATLSFSLATRDSSALVLYNGPLEAGDDQASDFVSVDLLEGRVRVLLNYGSGRQLEASPNLVINDGQLHRVLISWRADLLLVQLDHCLSVGNSNNSVQALSQCQHETRPSSSSSARAGSLLNVAAYPVQLGGARQVARWLDSVARRLNWSSAPLSSGSFTGCLHNLTFGHRVYDLSSPADSLHVLERCELLDSALPVITASPGFVVALIICLLLLIVLLVFMLLFRRKTRSHVLKQPMDELRDTIIKYNDEGGGEVDDLSYDLNVLQVPTPIFAKKELIKQKVDAGVAASTLTIAHFVEARRVKCDSDQNILPPDDVRDYAFEGFNSVAGSLSTLNTSGTTDDPLDFDYLKHAGGSFSTLNQLYNSPDDVEESDSDIAASTAASTTRC